MKKLFSMVLAVLLLFSMAACTQEETIEIDTITIEVVSEGQTEEFELEVKEMTLLELIDESELNISYQSSEYGSFVTGIENITATAGNYIAISKNGEASMVGIDEITFEADDTITFEIAWWDMTLQKVDQAINEFLEHHVDNYITETAIDYNVVSALNILGLTNEYVSQEDVQALYTNAEFATVNDYFKASILYGSVGLDASDLIDELLDMYTPGPYGQTAYGILAANSKDSSANLVVFNAQALTWFESNTPYDNGLDTGGISLVALSLLVGEENNLVSDFLTWIETDQLETGGIKTRDMVYGDVTYPGTENAASMAQVVLGMVSLGVNPTSETYTIEGNNLITRLLEFKTETGSYSWLFEGDEDLMFSTPQVFLALVAYQEMANTYGPVNPYIID